MAKEAAILRAKKKEENPAKRPKKVAAAAAESAGMEAYKPAELKRMIIEG